MPAPIGYTTLNASKIQDALGNLLTGTLEILPTDGNDFPITARAGGAGGQILITPAVVQVVAGAIVSTPPPGVVLGPGTTPAPVLIPDTSLTIPTNISYRFTFKDTTGKVVSELKGVQPTGDPWSLDTFDPNVPAQAAIVSGPPGLSAYQLAVQNGFSGTQAQWITSLQGAPGGISLPQLAISAGTAVVQTVPQGRNLFDPARSVPGAWGLLNGAVYNNGSSQWLGSGLIPVAGLQGVKANFAMGAVNAGVVFGSIFLNADLSVASQVTSPVPAGSLLPVPAGVAYLYCYAALSDNPGLTAANAMLTDQTGNPAVFQAFGFDSPSIVDAKIAAATATSAGGVSGYLPQYQNLLDLNRVQANVAIGGHGNDFTGQPALVTGLNGYSVFGPVPVIPGGTVTVNMALHTGNGYGPAFADNEGNLLVDTPGGQLVTFGVAGNGIPANTVLTVPPGAYNFWGYFNTAAGGHDGNSQIGSLATAMVVQGSTFPATYQPFLGSPIPDLTARSLAQPMAGGKIGICGDSISTFYPSGITQHWQDIAAASLGLTLAFDSHWAGRLLCDALDNSGDTTQPILTAAVAQSLDYLWLALGTNVASATGCPSAAEIGTPADPPNATGKSYANGTNTIVTFCSNLRGVLQQLLTWNPQLRIIWITPYSSAHYNTNPGYAQGVVPSAASIVALQQIAAQGVAVCQSLSVGYVDWFNDSGMNPFNNAVWTTDSLHPSAYAVQHVLAPAVARKTLLYSKN